jgi:hypothetical protein
MTFLNNRLMILIAFGTMGFGLLLLNIYFYIFFLYINSVSLVDMQPFTIVNQEFLSVSVNIM